VAVGQGSLFLPRRPAPPPRFLRVCASQVLLQLHRIWLPRSLTRTLPRLAAARASVGENSIERSPTRVSNRRETASECCSLGTHLRVIGPLFGKRSFSRERISRTGRVSGNREYSRVIRELRRAYRGSISRLWSRVHSFHSVSPVRVRDA